MGVSLLTVVLAASLGGGGLNGAQTAYMNCLDTELGAAISRRLDSKSFTQGIGRVCEEETAVYRRMAVASMVGQGMEGASPTAANARFDTYDRGNRAELIVAFEQRMKLRRGPARVSGLTTDRRIQHD